MEKRVIIFLILIVFEFVNIPEVYSSDVIEPMSVSEDFILGADVSSLPQVELGGAVFQDNGTETRLFSLLDSIGFRWARLRLWVDPGANDVVLDDFCDINHTLAMVQRIKAAGWKFLLDIHYSDKWADPGQQSKPHAWVSLSYSELKSMIYNYTFETLQIFEELNVLPDMVQVGNEISHGFLWDDGRTTNFDQFAELLQSGIDAVLDYNNIISDHNIEVMLHYAPGENCTGYKWWLNNLFDRNVGFDILGVSFYPKWHGTLENLEIMVNDIATNFSKDIIVVETLYPWTFEWNDDTSNHFWIPDLHLGYPATPEGQRAFYTAILNIINTLPNDRGRGMFLWEPAMVTPAYGGSGFENAALFDFNNELLDVYDIPMVLYPSLNTETKTTTRSSNSNNTDNQDENLKIFSYNNIISVSLFSLLVVTWVMWIKKEKIISIHTKKFT